MTNSHKILYTREEAADALSVSTTQIDEWRRAGQLAAVKFGKRGIRFHHEELDNFARSLQAA